MPAPRNETLARLTDVVVDAAYSRLANSGTDLLNDALQRIHQHLGVPLEVTANSTPNSVLNIGPGIYSLPDNRRIGVYADGVQPSLASGTINFASGAISTGSVSSFASARPTMTAGNFVRALIQYEIDSNAVDVTFGSQNAVLASTSIPTLKTGFVPVCLVELKSTAGGVGVWDAIQSSAIIQLLDFSAGGGEVAGPTEEIQVVVSPQSVFTLTTIVVPANRRKLLVYTNGIKETLTTDYSVTSDTQVTFVEPRPANAEITFRIG